jgi:hypothetical protein
VRRSTVTNKRVFCGECESEGESPATQNDETLILSPVHGHPDISRSEGSAEILRRSRTLPYNFQRGDAEEQIQGPWIKDIRRERAHHHPYAALAEDAKRKYEAVCRKAC